MDGVGADKIEALAESANLRLRPESVAAHQQRMREFRELIDQWDAVDLAFRFEDGVMSYAQVPSLYRPEEPQR